MCVKQEICCKNSKHIISGILTVREKFRYSLVFYQLFSERPLPLNLFFLMGTFLPLLFFRKRDHHWVEQILHLIPTQNYSLCSLILSFFCPLGPIRHFQSCLNSCRWMQDRSAIVDWMDGWMDWIAISIWGKVLSTFNRTLIILAVILDCFYVGTGPKYILQS